MNALVSTYSRPVFENEGYSSEDRQELVQSMPTLSLKFSIPPTPNVTYPELAFRFSLRLI